MITPDNENGIPDEPPLPDDAVTALELGNKIEAIKEVRIARGVGLKEAKDIVEDFIDNNPEVKARLQAAQSHYARISIRWLIAMTLFAVAIYYSR